MIVFICEIFKTQREKIQEDQIQINFTKKSEGYGGQVHRGGNDW